MNEFSQTLMEWHDETNKRELPWKGERNPYRIWLSEIILQQTRVEQGIGYYLKFIENYPTVNDLASSPDNEVFKHWEGLGYYSRCRNLLHSARTIVTQFNGQFPETYDALLKLKGIGSYTAAAIASFAYDMPHAVVDGNVLRVLARYFGIREAINEPAVKQKLSKLAQTLLVQMRPAAYNQAIMDFGATVCKPRNPVCNSCPLMPGCNAFKENLVEKLPFKALKAPRKQRFFAYYILKHSGKIWIRERKEKDIWRHLHEFFLLEVESEKSLEESKLKGHIKNKGWMIKSQKVFASTTKQILTHQEIFAAFVLVEMEQKPLLQQEGIWVNGSDLTKIAFPKTINNFLGYIMKDRPFIFCK